MLTKNGFLVQGFIENIYTQKYKNYNGVGRFLSWPLFFYEDKMAKKITNKCDEGWLDIYEISVVSDMFLINNYIDICDKLDIKTRVLLIESLVTKPEVNPANIDCDFLGFDYSSGYHHFSILVDDLSISDNIIEFTNVFDKLNSNLLFNSLEDTIKYVEIRKKLVELYDLETDEFSNIVKLSYVNIYK